MEKRRYWLTAFVFVLFLFFPLVSANFVCGEVVSESYVSPAWFSVQMHYVQNPQYTTTCEVSPADNKYCCDPSTIPQVAWGVGKEVRVAISDDEYRAGPVTGVISGEGYDILPQLVLKKIITVTTPDSGVYLNISEVFLNVTTLAPYTSLSYELYSNGALVQLGVVCELCTEHTLLISSLPFGTYVLLLNATSFEGDSVMVQKEFTLLESLTLTRTMTCEGCREGYVPSGKEVEVSVRLEASHPVTGPYTEYFPVSWALDETSGEFYSETHSQKKFSMNGTVLETSYSLRAPSLFITREFVFEGALGDVALPSSEVVVYRWYRFFPWARTLHYTPVVDEEGTRYREITPRHPGILYPEHPSISLIALFPTKAYKSVFVRWYTHPTLSLADEGDAFVLDSTLPDEGVSRVFLKYRIPLTHNASLYEYDLGNEQWNSVSETEYARDDEFLYYEAYVENEGIFAVGEEQ